MKIFYHVDNDGRACGAILKRRFPKAELCMYNYWYGESILEKIHKDEFIIFADIVPNTEILLKIYDITKNITIIDHHESSYDDIQKLGLVFDGKMTRDGLGACSLVWSYCYPEYPIPRGVMWIAEYDHWERSPDNKAFNFGLQTFNTYPDSKIWTRILHDDRKTIKMILRKGRNILSYIVPWYRRLLNSYAIEGYIVKDLVDGGKYSAILLNQGGIDSSVFDDTKRKYDVCIRVVFGKDQRWLVSITTDRDDLDLSKIAGRFGSGGHRKSAGFVVDQIDEFFITHEE